MFKISKNLNKDLTVRYSQYNYCDPNLKLKFSEKNIGFVVLILLLRGSISKRIVLEIIKSIII